MRLIRPALALALASTALALATPSGGSAATLPTPTRIVLFKGGDATPVGPAVQPAGKWTVSTAPARITTTNYGTLVEDTGLGPIGACTAKCGEWWYDPGRARCNCRSSTGTRRTASGCWPRTWARPWPTTTSGPPSVTAPTRPVPVVAGDGPQHLHAVLHQAEPEHPRLVEDQLGRTEHLLTRRPVVTSFRRLAYLARARRCREGLLGGLDPALPALTSRA